MVNIAHGTRDAHGRWHADNPEDYPPMDVHGQLPWSVLDQSTKHWQTRKKWWLDQGVEDITPRAHAPSMINTGRHGKTSGGVSRFDPFLTELLITWLTKPGDHIYDPCAGGPVRGIVSTHLGRKYTGIDLNATQIEANKRAATHLGVNPTWIHGDGRNPAAPNNSTDLILSCPPYHNLEKYSDHPADLSAMKWPDFVTAHQQIINTAAATLNNDRFFAWVIGDTRDYKGHLRGLPRIAANHITEAGLHITNELILVAPPGLKAKTMRIPWTAARTTTRRHQHIIIAVKGNRKTATQRITNAHPHTQT